ncbi:MAG: hypothetical protein ACOYNS_17535, partial [Bacteroidota bacterium]
MISIIIQTAIAAVPGLMTAEVMNSGLLFGVFIIISVSILLKTFSSAIVIRMLGNIVSGEKKAIPFSAVITVSLYCQLIPLFGKVAAVGLSIAQYSIGSVQRFSVLLYPNITMLGSCVGVSVPEFIGKADIFTLLFILYLSHGIRTFVSVSQFSAAA